MQRREVLIGCSTFLTGILVGTVLDGDWTRPGQALTQNPTPTETPTPTPTETPTPTPAETPTQTPTPTDTPSPTPTETPPPTDTPTPTLPGTTHGLDEQFTVGEGNQAVTYRVIRFYTAEELGGRVTTATPQGIYLVVVVELTNPRDDGISLPEEFRVMSPEANSWTTFDQSGSKQIANDNRIDQTVLPSKFVRSGETRRGAVAYDVDPDSTYHVQVVPTSDATEPEHYVRIGDLSSVEQL